MNKDFEAYKKTYIPLLRDYAKSLLAMFPADEYAGIPQNFIPEWGVIISSPIFA